MCVMSHLQVMRALAQCSLMIGLWPNVIESRKSGEVRWQRREGATPEAGWQSTEPAAAEGATQVLSPVTTAGWQGNNLDVFWVMLLDSMQTV